MTNGKHGGPRPNSGRPPDYGEPGVQTRINVTPRVRAFLKTLGDSYTEGVMHLVQKSREWREFNRKR